MVTTDFQLKT